MHSAIHATDFRHRTRIFNNPLHFFPAGSTQRCGSRSVRRSLPAAFFLVPSPHATIRTMTQRFTTSQWVPFPVGLVFAFFADPANLPRLMPANLRTRIEGASIEPAPLRPASSDRLSGPRGIAAGKGSEIVISFRPVPLTPFRVRWTAQIAEFQWNDHFCDEQVCGPFAAFRHCHRTQAQTRNGVAGTLVTDEIAFKMPLGFLGNGAGFFVRRKLAGSFAHRQEQLIALLQAASHPTL